MNAIAVRIQDQMEVEVDQRQEICLRNVIEMMVEIIAVKVEIIEETIIKGQCEVQVREEIVSARINLIIDKIFIRIHTKIMILCQMRISIQN